MWTVTPLVEEARSACHEPGFVTGLLPSSTSGGGRQLHRHRRVTGHRVQGDRAAVGGDDRRDQGEAEAVAALAGAGTRDVAAGEALEGVVDEVGGEAGAVVVDRETARSRAETVTVVPAGVYLRAFASRLVTTWCSRCSSPVTSTGSSGSDSRHWWSGASTRASDTPRAAAG